MKTYNVFGGSQHTGLIGFTRAQSFAGNIHRQLKVKIPNRLFRRIKVQMNDKKNTLKDNIEIKGTNKGFKR
jgi:hypothetical protein